MDLNNVGPKASWGTTVLISVDDVPRIMASFVVYGAMIGYGACVGVVGSTIPILSEELQVSTTSLGQLFFYRGVGYFTGGLLSACMLNLFDHKNILSKELLVFFSIFLSGLCTLLMSTCRVLSVIKILFLFQGLGFGGVDTFGVIALSEFWGQRVQPWLQAKTASFALGGMVGPLLIAPLGLTNTLRICAALCMSSTAGLVGGYLSVLYERFQDSRALYKQVREREEGEGVGEGDGDSESILTTTAIVLSRLERAIKGVFSLAPATDHELLSTELCMIEEALDDIDLCSVGSNEMMQEALFESLDQTLYLDQQQEEEGYAWPSSEWNRDRDKSWDSGEEKGEEEEDHVFVYHHRTLSFATARVADKLRDWEDSEETASHTGLPEDQQQSNSHSHSHGYSAMPVTLFPRVVTLILSGEMFLYFGVYYAFSGWVPTYVLQEGISENPAEGFYVVTMYFVAMGVGSGLAIPAEVLISTTAMMRASLASLSVGSIWLLLFAHDYDMLCIAAVIIGLSVSAMGPLILTLSNDYGLTMDAASTSAIVMGGTVGESVAPVLIGYLMQLCGGDAMAVSFFVMTLCMLLSYFYVHRTLTLLSSELSSWGAHSPHTHTHTHPPPHGTTTARRATSAIASASASDERVPSLRPPPPLETLTEGTPLLDRRLGETQTQTETGVEMKRRKYMNYTN